MNLPAPTYSPPPQPLRPSPLVPASPTRRPKLPGLGQTSPSGLRDQLGPPPPPPPPSAGGWRARHRHSRGLAGAGAASSDVGDVGLGAKDSEELVLVVLNVALHQVHARTKQPLERLHVQDCKGQTRLLEGSFRRPTARKSRRVKGQKLYKIESKKEEKKVEEKVSKTV